MAKEMTPAQVSQELTRIATAIDASKKPDPRLVAADIKKILAALSQPEEQASK